jgi:hypothetical protein
MHLETMRPALWQENISFLGGNDIAAIAAETAIGHAYVFRDF